MRLARIQFPVFHVTNTHIFSHTFSLGYLVIDGAVYIYIYVFSVVVVVDGRPNCVGLRNKTRRRERRTLTMSY